MIHKKNKKRPRLRFLLLGSFFALVCAVYIGRIVYLNLTYDTEGIVSSDMNISTKTVQAVRGEVYDRNGIKLIKNSYSYNVAFEKSSFPTDDEEINKTINRVLSILENKTETKFPFISFINTSEYYFGENDKNKSPFESMLEKFGLNTDIDANSFYSYILDRYKLLDENGDFIFTEEETFGICEIRYELERINFNTFENYVISENISTTVLNGIEEALISGVITEKNVSREYCYPGYASHILGRVGKIPEEEYESYKEKGYSMDAVVGVEGVEKAFEEYLHGTDGVIVTITDSDGNTVNEYYKTQPVAGKDVYLTIDIELQIATEDALAANIEKIKSDANAKIDKVKIKYADEDGNVPDWALANLPSKIGEDVSSGAATAINPNTGEVYALASNPTFDLTNFTSNYTSLSTDESKPLYNRALLGTYEPGSTFKVGVAAAALQTGTITKEETIYDKGRYTYYSDWQPECWIYTSKHVTHGLQNVVSAIQNSCNYFFYDVGRRLTIEKMNEYCTYFGLGQSTGIELPEKTGVLAGPAYRASIGEGWMPGDTVQAAIGQSDNLFTPLQLSVYISTVLNGGTRYKAHILKCVKDFGSGQTITESQPEIVCRTEISADNIATLKEGMYRVIENGTASSVFSNYPIEIGGKTGTAQVGKSKSNNGIFVAFAPYDDPEIVVSCVIEQAGGSNEIADTIKGMLNNYFNLG